MTLTFHDLFLSVIGRAVIQMYSMHIIVRYVTTFGATGGALGALEILERGRNKRKRKCMSYNSTNNFSFQYFLWK